MLTKQAALSKPWLNLWKQYTLHWERQCTARYTLNATRSVCPWECIRVYPWEERKVQLELGSFRDLLDPQKAITDVETCFCSISFTLQHSQVTEGRDCSTRLLSISGLIYLRLPRKFPTILLFPRAPGHLSNDRSFPNPELPCHQQSSWLRIPLSHHTAPNFFSMGKMLWKEGMPHCSTRITTMRLRCCGNVINEQQERQFQEEKLHCWEMTSFSSIGQLKPQGVRAGFRFKMDNYSENIKLKSATSPH